ncbi:MAG: signal peptidase [Solirubrobacteraceae bacterium]|jgi:signal peptidase|nr:signal peptidase [Solirubrobacteraceae bacterium]
MTAARHASPHRTFRLASLAAGGLGRVMLMVVVAVLAAGFAPTLLGLHRYVLTGVSMEPAIHRGSLIFDEEVPVSDLRVGDVITYVPPGAAHPLSHRIVSIAARGGERRYRTRGDNNPVADPAAFALPHPTQARVRFSIPYVGWPFIAMSRPGLRVWLVAVPAFVLAFWALAGVWREGGALLRERAAAQT